jgi:hypothetical protein
VIRLGLGRFSALPMYLWFPRYHLLSVSDFYYGYKKSELLSPKAIPGFNINSVSYEILGPVFDNDFGVMFSFKLQDCHDLEYNPSTWVKT